jgi:hypothetical protein
MRSTLPGDDGRLPVYPLRVFGVKAGQRVIVRLLSNRMYGAMTHWTKQGTVLCPGSGCEPAVHRGRQIWKGYTSAEVYDQQQGLWNPVCLEVTEHCELDLRDLYQRGQVWEIFRLPDHGKKHQPTQAVWLEERDVKTFPHEHDLVPCLLHLFHVAKLPTSVPNPLPPRTMVRSSVGEAPSAMVRQKEEPNAMTAEERERVKAMLRDRTRQFSRPDDPKDRSNGKGGNA